MTDTQIDESTTLQEGLELFYRSYRPHLEGDDIGDKTKAFFKSHDVAHVVFGCDITFYGEGLVKIWTVFGTTLGFWKHIKGYSDANAYVLFKRFSWTHLAKNLGKLLMSVPKTIIRAKQMNRPWPFSEYETYLNVPISEIRKEFNIRVL